MPDQKPDYVGIPAFGVTVACRVWCLLTGLAGYSILLTICVGVGLASHRIKAPWLSQAKLFMCCALVAEMIVYHVAGWAFSIWLSRGSFPWFLVVPKDVEYY